MAAPAIVLLLTLSVAAFADGRAATSFAVSREGLVGPWVEHVKLIAADGAPFDSFGFAVAVDGDTALVGALFAGAVYVFTRNGAVWSQQAKLTASDQEPINAFGCSVAVDGDTALVGARLSGNATEGAAYVFTRSGGVWSQQAKLTAADRAADDRFGQSVALAGDTALVGAYAHDVGVDADQGAAYVFAASGGVWSQQAKLTAVDGAENDHFGVSVAVAGDTALVGANLAAVDGDIQQGAAYVFTRSGGVWSHQAKLTAADGGPIDFFGDSVAFDGNTALLGASLGGNDNQGAAYVFTVSGGVWSQQTKLTAADGVLNDSFGQSVALAGDTALVGARQADVGGSANQGAAYVFTRSGGAWSEQAKLTAADGATDDDFGFSVALASNTALVGAHDADVGGNASQGAAYVFAPAQAVLSFTPASHDFGLVQVGNSVVVHVTLQNTGAAAATNLSLSGPAAPFSQTNTCPATLQPQEQCTVSAEFAPTAAGTFSDGVTAGADGGVSAGLALDGEGVSAPGIPPTPADLEVDGTPLASDGNRVFEPGEQVEVVPAWRNDDSAALSLTGTASGFAGPPGATYAEVLTSADYGTIAPGAVASCLSTGVCYVLEVNDPAIRPALHWDATFGEILDDPSATTTSWILHLGASFGDVPPSHLFYRFVETILHHGMAMDCGGGDFCPHLQETRAMMAMAVLRGLEGSAYEPPSCVSGEEAFLDVPAADPFCPWIQELSGRDVTVGCGGGNYCPDAPVTRAQMAVFLLKALEGVQYTPPPCQGIFEDVSCQSPFGDWIEELFHRGVTAGCGSAPARYCPGTAITLGQCAVFQTRNFSLDLYR